jgi:hypothetical protein
MAQLFFTIFHTTAPTRELKEWIESRGLEIESIRIISDLVARASPAFAYARLKDQCVFAKPFLCLTENECETGQSPSGS